MKKKLTQLTKACMNLKLVQSYAEKLPIPINPPNSSPTCCDGIMKMRHNLFNGIFVVAK